jgi:predicted outer membrane protein
MHLKIQTVPDRWPFGEVVVKWGIVAALVLAALAGTALVMRYWYAPTQANYEPVRMLTDNDRSVLLSFHDILEALRIADQHAATRAASRPVRDFAANAAEDHARLIVELTARAGELDPALVFPPAKKQPEPDARGIRYDREYLNAFIAAHDHARAVMRQAVGTEDNPSIQRFVSLWRAEAGSHLTEARRLLGQLPSVASNVALLLVAGILFLLLAVIMLFRNRTT